MKVFRLLSVALVLALSVSIVSCNQVKDSDIQKSARELLSTNPELSGVNVTVQDKIATLSGTVSDDTSKNYAESIVAGVKNIKSVINQLEVIPPAPDFSILDKSINDTLPEILKDYNTVTATAQNGIITLNGEIKEKDLQILMEKLYQLNPEQVVNNLTIK